MISHNICFFHSQTLANVRFSEPFIHEALASHIRAYHAVHHHHHVHTHPDPDYKASYPQKDQEEIAPYHTLQGAGNNLYRPAGQEQRSSQAAAAVAPSPNLAEPQGSHFEEAAAGIPKVCAHRRGSSRQVGNLL